LLGRRAWREPLAAYEEIRVDRELRSHRAGVRAWYVARLWHPEPAKALELARAKDPARIDQTCARSGAAPRPAAELVGARGDGRSRPRRRAPERARHGECCPRARVDRLTGRTDAGGGGRTDCKQSGRRVPPLRGGRDRSRPARRARGARTTGSSVCRGERGA
jgi:hypothetical protein